MLEDYAPVDDWKLFTRADIAALFQVSLNHADKIIEAEFKTIEVGRCKRVPFGEIRRYYERKMLAQVPAQQQRRTRMAHERAA